MAPSLVNFIKPDVTSTVVPASKPRHRCTYYGTGKGCKYGTFCRDLHVEKGASSIASTTSMTNAYAWFYTVLSIFIIGRNTCENTQH